MDSLWPKNFQEVNIVKPLDIIRKQADYLSTMTDKLVYGEVGSSDGLIFLKKGISKFSFSYFFDIRSKYVDKYSFRVFSFAHDIPIYPVTLILNADIQTELKIDTISFIASESDTLINILSDVLHTNKVQEVVGSLITLSKDKI